MRLRRMNAQDFEGTLNGSIWANDLPLDRLPPWPLVSRPGDLVNYQVSLALEVGHPVLVIDHLGPVDFNQLPDSLFECQCGHCS